MINKSSSKSPLFLMELTIVILFFSLCSAICMNIFASSQITSQKATSLTGSVLACQSVSAVYKAENGDLEKVASILDGEFNDNTVIINYTTKWERTTDALAPCYISLVKDAESSDAIISAHNESEETELFLIKVKLVEVAQ